MWSPSPVAVLGAVPWEKGCVFFVDRQCPVAKHRGEPSHSGYARVLLHTPRDGVFLDVWSVDHVIKDFCRTSAEALPKQKKEGTQQSREVT